MLAVLTTAAAEAREPVEAMWCKPMVLVYALEHVALVRQGVVCVRPSVVPKGTPEGLEVFLH